MYMMRLTKIVSLMAIFGPCLVPFRGVEAQSTISARRTKEISDARALLNRNDCIDDTSWEDSKGRGCDFVGENSSVRCHKFGAADACCICNSRRATRPGGGQGGRGQGGGRGRGQGGGRGGRGGVRRPGGGRGGNTATLAPTSPLTDASHYSIPDALIECLLKVLGPRQGNRSNGKNKYGKNRRKRNEGQRALALQQEAFDYTAPNQIKSFLMEHADDNDDDTDDEASSEDNLDGISESYEYNLDEDKVFGDQSSYLRKLQKDEGRREDINNCVNYFRSFTAEICVPTTASPTLVPTSRPTREPTRTPTKSPTHRPTPRPTSLTVTFPTRSQCPDETIPLCPDVVTCNPGEQATSPDGCPCRCAVGKGKGKGKGKGRNKGSKGSKGSKSYYGSYSRAYLDKDDRVMVDSRVVFIVDKSICGESQSPSESPSQSPSESPSQSPSQTPSESPSQTPSQSPSESPSESPTRVPTLSPTLRPTSLTVTLPTRSICDDEDVPSCPDDTCTTNQIMGTAPDGCPCRCVFRRPGKGKGKGTAKGKSGHKSGHKGGHKGYKGATLATEQNRNRNRKRDIESEGDSEGASKTEGVNGNGDNGNDKMNERQRGSGRKHRNGRRQGGDSQLDSEATLDAQED